MSEIEKYQSDIRIPLFDKESADFCFEKSRELLSRPFNLATAGSSSTPMTDRDPLNKSKSSKPRDFIGENLLDIENTLKALNLDFLNAFNELEKTDSAETLFGEQRYDANPKLRNSALRLSAAAKQQSYSATASSSNKQLDFSSPKSVKSMQFSPSDLAKQQQHLFEVGGGTSSDRLDDKRSSTPDTGFASRETNGGGSSSRRSSGQKSCSYSPQEHVPFRYGGGGGVGGSREFAGYSAAAAPPAPPHSLNVRQTVHSSINSINSLLMQQQLQQLHHHQQHYLVEPSSSRMMDDFMGSYPNRKRSMSFTEHYEDNLLQSPVLSEPQSLLLLNQMYSKQTVVGGNDSGTAMRRHKSRTAAGGASYKPRSIKARNLRRLSYNPIVLGSSSSSSTASSGSECDYDKSIAAAHSECDIRSTVSTTSRRRRYQYLKRNVTTGGSYKATTSNKSSTGADKLYGSNASIKSAPHYNYNYVSDRQLHKYLDQKFSIGGVGGYDFNGSGGRHGEVAARFESSVPPSSPPPPPPPQSSVDDPTKSAKMKNELAYNHLYSEFDVSKLTGKSPTTQSFLTELFPDLQQQQQQTLVPSTTTTSSAPPILPPMCRKSDENVFQWPDKIHASTVKQNEFMWRQQQRTAEAKTAKVAYSSESSSSTETDPAMVGFRSAMAYGPASLPLLSTGTAAATTNSKMPPQSP